MELLRARLALVLAFAVVLALGAVSASDAQPSDPAARGLDLFVHGPQSAAPGEELPLSLEAIGFATVVKGAPLPKAAIEAAWDPETLGPVSVTPPSVKVETDANGRAHIDVPMPDGDEADLDLLLSVRSGKHARTRSVKVHRTRLLDVALHVTDRRVVPGGAVSAWVLVQRASSGEPAASVPVHLALLEGGVPRFEARLTTDASGNASVRVAIPRSDEPAWSWILEARAISDGPYRPTTARMTLTPREETPGAARLTARFSASAVSPGDPARYSIVLRDATDQPIADVPVRVWLGPRGAEPPKSDEAWLDTTTRSLTDAQGEVSGETVAPSAVKRGGTTITLVARAHAEGRDLEAKATLGVGVGAATATLSPEAKSIVPGVEQRMLLRVLDGFGKPVSAEFVVEGDGLRGDVKTDASGEAEIAWRPPVDVGAQRNVGPCAGGVAASVRVRSIADVPQLLPRRDPFDVCVPVDREAAGIARADRSAARVGEKLHVAIAPAPTAAAKVKAAGPWSVVLRAENGASAASLWIEDGERGGDVTIPSGAMGVWTLSAAAPSAKHGARVLTSSLLVTPKRLPKIEAVVAGGRAAPGGAVDVDVTMTDEKGAPMPGSVAAVMVDARGGGSTAGVLAADTRRALCARLGYAEDRCDAIALGDPALDVYRRAELAALPMEAVVPLFDPGENATSTLRASFAEVVRSLEGAVFEASSNADSLRDVRRREGTRWMWNPELMTLVTAALPQEPLTPGGEPLALADLLAVDPQVTFDNVARRVTRLKLFEILTAVRAFRREHMLDPDEPALQHPDALVRRLVREGRLTEDMLVDPWGGTIQFVKSSAPPIPFLSAARGFELRAPGPDGKIGDADDVRDPFERVLRSNTPYADAVQEDRIVDAKSEMEVSDETVARWQETLSELTGMALGGGRGEGVGVGGVGEIGGGHGFGVGQGFGSGHGRLSLGIDDGVAFWSAPQSTDDHGKLRLHVPLRDLETTWSLAVFGVPRGGTPATTAIDIPVSLPMSARVDAGASWIEGDEGGVAVTIRNRGARALHATVTVAASGAVALAERRAGETSKEPFAKEVDVLAESTAVLRVHVRARTSGDAVLDVRLQSASGAEDMLRHRWEVKPAGEATDFTSAKWIDGDAELALTMPPRSIRVTGAPRLVIERGFDEALAGALDALDPDDESSARAMADTIEVASRIERWAIARGGEKDPLVEKARAFARRAVGKLVVYELLDDDSARTPELRAALFAPLDLRARLDEGPECPRVGATLDDLLETAETEPAPRAGVVKPCWDGFVTNLVERVEGMGTAEELARLVLAVVDRPHRQLLATALVDRLRERVDVKPSGAIVLPDELAAKRSARAIVYAALLRSAHVGGAARRVESEKLAAWIAVQRDVEGSYGSTLATRMVVRALLAEGAAPTEPTRVTVTSGALSRTIDIAASGRARIDLPKDATRVRVEVKGPGVTARFERPVLRLWSSPPSTSASPLRVEPIWPEGVHAGHTGTLRLRLQQSVGEAITADVTLPLPPGVTLAEPIDGARQIQGALRLRRSMSASALPDVVEIPLRFALPGRFTIPEARARVAYQELPRAVAPSRPITIGE